MVESRSFSYRGYLYILYQYVYKKNITTGLILYYYMLRVFSYYELYPYSFRAYPDIFWVFFSLIGIDVIVFQRISYMYVCTLLQTPQTRRIAIMTTEIGLRGQIARITLRVLVYNAFYIYLVSRKRISFYFHFWRFSRAQFPCVAKPCDYIVIGLYTARPYPRVGVCCVCKRNHNIRRCVLEWSLGRRVNKQRTVKKNPIIYDVRQCVMRLRRNFLRYIIIL